MWGYSSRWEIIWRQKKQHLQTWNWKESGQTWGCLIVETPFRFSDFMIAFMKCHLQTLMGVVGKWVETLFFGCPQWNLSSSCSPGVRFNVRPKKSKPWAVSPNPHISRCLKSLSCHLDRLCQVMLPHSSLCAVEVPWLEMLSELSLPWKSHQAQDSPCPLKLGPASVVSLLMALVAKKILQVQVSCAGMDGHMRGSLPPSWCFQRDLFPLLHRVGVEGMSLVPVPSWQTLS